MGDARDKAIEFMQAGWLVNPGSCGTMLDGIPDDVLVAYAIERGALVETDKKIVIGRDYQAGKYHNYFALLYRLATEDDR